MAVQELKRSLKKWETDFLKERGRRPVRDDISGASERVRLAYLEYSRLRKEENRAAGRGVAVAEPWGKELNKAAAVVGETASGAKEASGSSFLQRLSSKMFAVSERMDRNRYPGCGRAEIQKGRCSRRLADGGSSANTSPLQKVVQGHSRLPAKQANSQLSEAPPETCDQVSRPAGVFELALNLVSKKGTERSKVDVETAPEFEDFSKHNKFAVSVPSDFKDYYLGAVNTSDYNAEDGEELDSGYHCDQDKTVDFSNNQVYSSLMANPCRDIRDSQAKKASIKNAKMNQNLLAQEVKTRGKSITSGKIFQNEQVSAVSLRKSRQDCEVAPHSKAAVSDKVKIDVDRSESGITEKDCGLIMATLSKRKRKYEFSQQVDDKKKRCLNLVTSHDNNLTTGGLKLEKGPTTSSKVQHSKKRVSKSSSENYLRLNMKVKRYVRKGKRFTAATYRRQQWKKKMRNKSKNFGNKCFECGQPGHWANACPDKLAKNDHEANAELNLKPVLEEDFPTLSQAANMARGVKVSDTSEELDVDILVGKHGMNDPDNDILLEAVEPFLTLRQDGSIPDIPSVVFNTLKQFGYEDFRDGQKEAIMRILCGLSTLVVLSTGGGKSLCYQIPAYLYGQKSKCMCLVISPLVSLMEDQVSRLPPGIRGACLHTNMTRAQRDSVVSAANAGNLHFLLVSPEAVAGGKKSIMSNFRDVKISFVCIDEAHCLSEWSHNFRPSYLRICKVLRDMFGVQTFMGLTATATLATAVCVAKHLGIDDLDRAVIRGLPVPRNLSLSVSRDDDKNEALIELLQERRFSQCNSIIVYCTRREETERLATLMRTCLKDVVDSGAVSQSKQSKKQKETNQQLVAESYHAGLSPFQRKRVQNAFMSGRLRIVVATVAFGMGIDKPDVRGIIHYNMPKSFENFVQEIGRAGRDGKLAECHLFLDSMGREQNELKKHIFENTVDRITIKWLVQKVFKSCRCKEIHEKYSALKLQNNSDVGKERVVDNCKIQSVCASHERVLPIEKTVLDLDLKEENIATLLCYLELHGLLKRLPPAYATCKIRCYGGPAQLQALARKYPPVAAAIAKQKLQGKTFANANSIEFPVVEISDIMGWNSGCVKRELHLLEWNFDPTGLKGPGKSGVMVEFSDLSFHLCCPGDKNDEELDEIISYLHERVELQERTELYQIHQLHVALKSVAYKNNWSCSNEMDQDRNTKLHQIICNYFDKSRNSNEARTFQPPEQQLYFHEEQLRMDIRKFINLYSCDHKLTGLAIARIFYGIGSPCYPAKTWGRVRLYWRRYLDADFKFMVKIATQEIIKSRI